MSHQTPPLRSPPFDNKSIPIEQRGFSPPWERWFSTLSDHVNRSTYITVSTTAPAHPKVNDLWYDIS